ncbi:peptide chain release factor N(5)-glutamine methyltransferase [bacterium]|nr:peptide chain release factor N(5)-glutamine methyltransferase [bacterium]
MNSNQDTTARRPNGIWRLGDILREGTLFLSSRQIENPRLDAERLLCKVMGKRRIDLYLCHDQPVSPAERAGFKNLLLRRASREPLQYILGETEFMSLPFRLSPHVLIPRPETEILVEMVLNLVPVREAVSILDIGTGSGCIAVSLAFYLPRSGITAVDISRSALDIAAENAVLNGVQERIRFQILDIRSPESPPEFESGFRFIVSNPPYISQPEWETLAPEIKNHEPGIALYAGADGLSLHRLVAEKSFDWLQAGGMLILEVGLGQADPAGEILRKKGYRSVASRKDLAGVERIVSGIR